MLERSGLLLTIAIVFCTTAIANDQITLFCYAARIATANN